MVGTPPAGTLGGPSTGTFTGTLPRVRTGTARRAVALYGIGAAMTVALATPSAAVAAMPDRSYPAVKPHPESDDAKQSGTGHAGTADAGNGAKKAGTVEAAGPVPKLSIGIDNGRTAAREGDRLTYTVTVHNIGTTDARRLRLAQTMPPGLKFVSADGHGTVRKGEVAWTVDLPAGEDATFHTTAQVLATPEDLLRLATIACASTGENTRPIVCAAHSDQLPAGAAAAAAQEASPASGRPWYLPAGAALLTAVAFGAWALVRRGKRPFGPRQPS
ncbi:hypothetical protein [Streptosporangium sp. NPDC051022]|uniref:hypothetical protein n=1 Tax=Streptosporangium sp. NPDC051022 TaxID=3155752 RepID=UPI0034167DF1